MPVPPTLLCWGLARLHARAAVVGETMIYVEQRLPDLVWRETYDVPGFAAPIDGEPH